MSLDTRRTRHESACGCVVDVGSERASVVVYGRADESASDDFVVLGDSDESDRHASGLH